MPKSVNKVILLGNLGKDAETSFMTDGTAKTTFTLATTVHYKSGDGYKERTEWHTVVIWKREKLAEYLTKGSRVYVEGEIRYRSTEDPATGQKRYYANIHAHEIVLLGGKRDGGDEAVAPDNDYDVPF